MEQKLKNNSRLSKYKLGNVPYLQVHVLASMKTRQPC